MTNYGKLKGDRALATVFILVICFNVLLSGCGGGGDDDGAGGPSYWVLDKPITTNDAAGINVGYLHDAVTSVLSSLANGTYSGKVINCITGTVTVTGTEASQNQISCGSSCVQSTYDADITFVFNNCNWKNLSNAYATINGSIKYSRSDWSRQSGLSFSSSKSMQMNNVNGKVQFREVIDQGTSTAHGYKDTFAFNASGSNPYLLHGTLTAQNGVTYTY
jgi:hypothetical protein